MITTKELISKYGTPNAEGTYLTRIDLPYPMTLSWDRDKTVTKMSCHKLVADKFKAVFEDVLKEYGIAKIKELEIDVFGGCFNFRKMRGGTELSRHCWGVAIDLNPDENTLKMPYLKSQFAKPEYNKLHAIFEKHGFENLGKVKGYDSMHWQIKN